jgi:integrase
MPKRTLTDRFLKSLKPAAPGKRLIVGDSVVPGFGVRVTDKGTKTFVLVNRFGGKNPTPRALGEYGALTLEGARGMARQWLGLIGNGIDPKREAERRRLERQRRQKDSFAAVAEDFIKREGSKKARGEDMARELRQEFVARWGDRPVTEITHDDVLAVLDDAVDRGSPNQAHALFGHVRRLYNWAIGRGCYGLTGSPCDRIRPKDAIGKREARTHILSDDELAVLWRVSGRVGYPFGPMYRLLVLTGLRLTEVSGAQWPEFDLKQKIWSIPAARMKGRAPHLVPLTNDMLALLASLPRFNSGDYLFSTTHGRRPVSGFSKAKARLDRRMAGTWGALGRLEGKDRKPVEDWRTHDIRRVVRTHLSALPVTDLVRELILAHAQSRLHKTYDQYAYLDERRRCLELWNARLRSIVEPTPVNMVSLRVKPVK